MKVQSSTHHEGIVINNKQKEQSQNVNIHVIVPVFNESRSILNVLKRIHSTLKKNYRYQITVIDDGSTDNTWKILKNFIPDIKLIRNQTNLGKGESLKKALSLIKKNEIAVILDGDGEHYPEEIPKLIKPILNNKADIVIGSRFLKSERFNFKQGSYLKNKKKFSRVRKFGNNIISWLIFLIYHKMITDSQCGFRAFAPGVVLKYIPRYSRFEVETEMTINFIKKNLQIIEVPIDSGLSTRESHMNIIRDSLKIFFVIIDMKLKNQNHILINSIFNVFYPKEIVRSNNTEIKLNNNHPQLSFHLKDFKKDNFIISNKSKYQSKISIIIPCYNEANTILPIINAIQSIHLPNFELIIVDDGSTDNSVFVIKKCKNVKLLRHTRNIGYGKSLIDGIEASTGEIIVTIDSDGQHNPHDILNLCKPILEGRSDIVIGSRYAGKYFYRIPIVNRVGESFIELIILLIFGQTIKNNQGGFRAFHKRTISIFQNIKFIGMAFTTEILMKSFLQGFRVEESPILLYGRPIGKSRVKKIPLFLNLIRCFLFYGNIHLKKKLRI